ncbi:putative mediator of RNA polymerase II transcription subunit 26a/b [Helianthus debilis subsp. tardiflorus]
MVPKPTVVKPSKQPVVDSILGRRMKPNMDQKLQNHEHTILSTRPVTLQQRKPMSSGGETDQDKLEATKRKLQESYKQAEKETTKDTRDMPDVKALRPNGCCNLISYISTKIL